MNRIAPWMQQMQTQNLQTRRELALSEAKTELGKQYEDFDAKADFKAITRLLDKGLTTDEAYSAKLEDGAETGV